MLLSLLSLLIYFIGYFYRNSIASLNQRRKCKKRWKKIFLLEILTTLAHVFILLRSETYHKKVNFFQLMHLEKLLYLKSGQDLAIVAI